MKATAYLRSTRRNLLLPAAAALALVVAAVVLGFVARSWPFVSPDRMQGISGGTTAAQVVAIMGEPAARLHYGTDQEFYLIWNLWPNRIGIVEFSSDGRVVRQSIE